MVLVLGSGSRIAGGVIAPEPHPGITGRKGMKSALFLSVLSVAFLGLIGLARQTSVRPDGSTATTASSTASEDEILFVG